MIPQVPTLAEVGVKAFEAVSWFMLVAAAGTPPEIVDRLYREANAIIGDPGGAGRVCPAGAGGGAFALAGRAEGFIAAEIASWSEIVDEGGLLREYCCRAHSFR